MRSCGWPTMFYEAECEALIQLWHITLGTLPEQRSNISMTPLWAALHPMQPKGIHTHTLD